MNIIKLKMDPRCVAMDFFNSWLLLSFNSPKKKQQQQPLAVILKFYKLIKIKLNKTSVFIPFLYIHVIICKYLPYESL